MTSAIDINTLPNQTERDREEIIKSARGIIWKVIGKHAATLSPDDLAELHGDAMAAVNRAATEYDPSRGVAFATLVVRYVIQAKRDFFRSHGGNHYRQEHFERSVGRVSDCLAELAPDANEESAERQHRAAQRQTMEITIDMARNDGILDEREYRVLVMRRENYLEREIGEAVGVCPQRVHQIIGEAVGKIRAQYRTAE